MLNFNFSAKCRRVLRKRSNWFIILIVILISYFYVSSLLSSNNNKKSPSESKHSSTSTSTSGTTVERGKKSDFTLKREPELHRAAAQNSFKEASEGYSRMAYFWSGDGLRDFLVKGFDINAHEGLAFLCVGLASSAILYEGLRTLRDSYLNKFVDKQKANRALENKKRVSQRLKIGGRREGSPIPGPSGDYGGGGDTGDASISLMRAPLEDDDDYELRPQSRNTIADRLSGQTDRQKKIRIFLNLIISTFLHMIYIFLGYILMLAVMTFNVWILVAVAIGIGIGQFVFGIYRRTDIVLSHHADNIICSRKSSSDYCEEEFSSPSTATLEVSGVHGRKKDSISAPTSQCHSQSTGCNEDQEACDENNPYHSTSSRSDNTDSSEQLTTEILVHSDMNSKESPSGTTS